MLTMSAALIGFDCTGREPVPLTEKALERASPEPVYAGSRWLLGSKI